MMARTVNVDFLHVFRVWPCLRVSLFACLSGLWVLCVSLYCVCVSLSLHSVCVFIRDGVYMCVCERDGVCVCIRDGVALCVCT